MSVMRVMNYTEFRSNLAKSLNVVNDDHDILVVSCSKGKNVVVMGLEEYSSIQETLYLTSTRTNREKLDAAIDEMHSRCHYDK